MFALADDTSGNSPARDGGYVLAPGDLVKITVYQVPDLTLEARIEDNGTVSYPLLGMLKLSGLTVGQAESLLGDRLKSGGYLTAPNITVAVLQVRGYQVTVLGHVGKAGRYPLESRNTRLSDVLAIAGGVDKDGSEVVVLSGTREGKPFRREYLLSDMGAGGEDDPLLAGGDLLYVPPAPIFYITGEIQKPGSYRLERGMTLVQALAIGGGLTPKATKRGMTVKRATPGKKIQELELGQDDPILPNDVITIREGLF